MPSGPYPADPNEQTYQALVQVGRHLMETAEWLGKGQAELDPVYAERLRVKLAAARDIADEAWKNIQAPTEETH